VSCTLLECRGQYAPRLNQDRVSCILLEELLISDRTGTGLNHYYELHTVYWYSGMHQIYLLSSCNIFEKGNPSLLMNPPILCPITLSASSILAAGPRTFSTFRRSSARMQVL
jgi:hypothetical protein